MVEKIKRLIVFVISSTTLSACSGIQNLSNNDQVDTTDPAVYKNASDSSGAILSAFYGLDDSIPWLASLRICGELGHSDGMPIVFSEEVDFDTVEAGDFLVTLSDGETTGVGCVTPAPATDLGEFRTILMIGNFGSIDNQPTMVTIKGNLLSLDHKSNFKNEAVMVTPLEDGPFLVHAELVDTAQWQIGKKNTLLPFGGGDGCPLGTQQIIRVVWAGGVTKPGGSEIDDQERTAYRVILEDGSDITPFAIGDLGDGDNNHQLCLNTDSPVQRVEFPEGLMTDPREDVNPAIAISLKI